MIFNPFLSFFFRFAVLYENADYCQPDTCLSKPLRKGVVEKLKEWWRDRFGRCPGGCQEHADEERCLAAISYSSKDINDSSRIYPWACLFMLTMLLCCSLLIFFSLIILE